MPIFSPLEIMVKWDPCLVVSVTIFAHQKKADVIIIMLNRKKLIFIVVDKLHRMYDTRFHEIIAFKIGHGLGEIMWNG